MMDVRNDAPTLRLGGYLAAAGALGLAGPATAATFEFAPDGGLPILVDSGDEAGVDLDLDGDAVADFRLFYLAPYGGGFSIAAINTGDSDNGIHSHDVSRPGTGALRAVHRLDGGEPTPPTYLEFDPGTFSLASGTNVLLDFSASVTYRPFRENPGFVMVKLQPDSGTGGLTPLPEQIGWFEIVVDPTGRRLKVLSGGRSDTPFDDIRLPATTPPSSALSELAAGAR